MEVFQEGGRLVAGSQRLNETADTLLDHPHQIPPVDMFCTQVLVSYSMSQLQVDLHIHHLTFSTK